MKKFKGTYRVESARLPAWDYSTPGSYFVTIVVRWRQCLLGDVRDRRVVLSPLGEMAERLWQEIPLRCPNASVDAFVVMPNHVHGIIRLENPAGAGRDVRTNISTGNLPNAGFFAMISPPRGSLGVVVRTYKAGVTTWACRQGYAGFAWQERFYDHIIRDDADLHRIRSYVADNPGRWEAAPEHGGPQRS
jgi:putative transposase